MGGIIKLAIERPVTGYPNIDDDTLGKVALQTIPIHEYPDENRVLDVGVLGRAPATGRP